MTKVYLAGKMTGLTGQEIINNFRLADVLLTSYDYDVVNPAEIDQAILENESGIHDPDPQDYEQWMKRDLELLEECDAICLIAGWQDSAGAKRELARAVMAGLSVMTVIYDDKDGLPCAVRVTP